MAKSVDQDARDIVAEFIEKCGADAVVVVYSKVKKHRTQTFIIPYGNAHTCSALIDYAYECFTPPELIDVELDEDDED